MTVLDLKKYYCYIQYIRIQLLLKEKHPIMSLSIESVLSGLNEQQKAAVTFNTGPLMIIAGAGTGKTKVITHRIAYLIAARKANPEEILALTFTEKAAAEMEERVDVLLPYGIANVWISTFHAFGDRLLRDNALELGLTPDFQVLSEAEQNIFFKSRLFEFPLKLYRPLGNPTKFITALLRLYSRAKDEDVSVEEYARFAEQLAAEAAAHSNDPELAESAQQQMEIAQTFAKYQQLMAQEGKIDFGDQISLVLRLLREHPQTRRALQKRLKYILVDEFQDTNYAQFEMVKLLAQSEEPNITVVADDDQSIYKFRGAAISNVLQFQETYPQAKTVVLVENYRSTQKILDSAYKLIRHNDPDRLEVKNSIDKKLRAQNIGELAVQHLHYDSITTESDAVAKLIADKVRESQYSYRDFAILVRANSTADPFLRAMNMRRIPHRFTGSRGLYNRQEIRLLLSFFRTITDLDDSLSLYHLASSDVYAFPIKGLTRCIALANSRNRSLGYIFENIEKMPELEDLSAESIATIRKLNTDIEHYLRMSTTNSAGVLLYNFLIGSGYLKRLTSADVPEAEIKLSNIAKFFNIVRDFSNVTNEDGVREFIAHLDLLMEAGDDPATAQADPDIDAVNVLTLHRAKGLEFPVVFIVSLVKDRFPARSRSEPIELPNELIKDVLPSGDFHLQEERRLFYVGMTRAEKELYLTSARDYGGTRPRSISPFVLEALDAPQADDSYIRVSPLEAIHRNAPVTESSEFTLGQIPKDKVLTLSFYQIDDYLTCPLKYKYIHILRVPLLPHHTITYGLAIHNAVSEYYRRKISGKSVAADDLITVFKASWKSEGFVSREHEERRYTRGQEVLREFFAEQERQNVMPALVEEDFTFLIDENRLIGRWDRVDEVDGHIHIIDFKSSEVLHQDKADKNARDNLQLSIYALAYQKVFGETPSTVALYYLESGIVGQANVTQKKLQTAVDKINTAAAGIRERYFEAKPNPFVCQYCAYNNICPATVSN